MFVVRIRNPYLNKKITPSTAAAASQTLMMVNHCKENCLTSYFLSCNIIDQFKSISDQIMGIQRQNCVTNTQEIRNKLRHQVLKQSPKGIKQQGTNRYQRFDKY